MGAHRTRLIAHSCPISVECRLAVAIAELNYAQVTYYGIHTQTYQKCVRGLIPRFRSASLARLSSLLL
jgi:hypothetical protein